MAFKRKNLTDYKKDIIIYGLLFFIMLILNRANVVGLKIPLAAAFAHTLIFLNKNAFAVSILFIISALFYDISLAGIIITLSSASAMILLYLSFKLINKKINFVWAMLIFLLGQVAFVYFNISNESKIIVSLVIVVVSLMFMYISNQTFQALFLRGFQGRFTFDESICFAIFLIALSSGVSNLYFFNINITNLIVALIILFGTRLFSKAKNINIAVLIGLGVSFSQGNVIYIALYVCWAVVALLFSESNKILPIVAIIITDLVLGSFFNVYAYYSYLNIISIVVAGIIFVCIPVKKLSNFVGTSYDYEGSLANEFLITGQMQLLKNKIVKISELFSQMQNTYINLSIGGLDKKNAARLLTEEVVTKHCRLCPNYRNCLENKEIKNSIVQLFDFGLEKQKVTIIDASNLLTSECRMISGLITQVNNNLDKFWQYEKKVKDDNLNKVAIAEQFAGTSSMLKELSGFVFCGEKINYKASRILLDELTLNGVIVNEAMVLENKMGVAKLVIIARTKDALSSNIAKSIYSVFKIRFDLDVCKMTRFAGWSVLCFTPAAKYDLSVGVACSSVSSKGVSGDNYSITKLVNNKMLIALSDGMGHGDGANKISSMALNLIENFYQSGFSSEVVLSSVNNILLPTGDDNFTTIDACIVDKNNATVDFIKVGASCSVIKSLDGARLVEVDNLPLGIMEKVQTTTKRCVLKDRDVVVLASDGVVDSFSSQEEFLNYINNERIINMQMFAENILEEAESRNLNHKDDKTVITFKIGAKV